MDITIQNATTQDLRDLFSKQDPDVPKVEDFHFAIAGLVNGGRKIAAIKLYRMLTGEGLAQSKKAAEDIADANPNW